MDSATPHVRTLAAAVLIVLRPLIRVLLRNGMTFRSFSNLAKRVYVEIGMTEFGIAGKKQTISRVAILTGLTRKEVQRVLNERTPDDTEARERYNRAARVVAGWVRDDDFVDEEGRPAALPLEGSSGFGLLVRRYSGDVPARAVLDELVHVGAVEHLNDGRVRLRSRAYVPRTSDLDKVAILGTDVADLIATIDHNLQSGEGDPFFQRKVMYDNLPADVIPELRRLSAEQSQQLVEKLDRWLSQRDRDVNPNVKGSGRRRAGIGIFYFEEDLATQPREETNVVRVRS
jgi:hypothetical protein